MEKFKFRAFTALMMFWSFILETVSGVILYIVPPGRVANWTDWKLWGLTKHQWAATHTILGYVFLVFALLHIYYNWKAITNYLKRKVKTATKMRVEFSASFLLTVLFTCATLLSIPPFGSIMDFGEKIKNSWEDNQNQPFAPHSELLSFDKFLEEIDISNETALEIFKLNGIKIKDQNMLIKDIAAENKISPAKLYSILESALPSEDTEKVRKITSEKSFSGRGYGWKTIEDIAHEINIPANHVLNILRSKGIDAKKEDVIRNIATKYDKKVIEIVEMLRNKQF